MAGWMSRLTLNQKLAAGAVALGAVALFAAPYPGSKVTLDARELALVVGAEADHVEAPELAAWIIESRADYRLVDLRTEQEFAALLHPDGGEHPDERPDGRRPGAAGEDRALLRGRHPLGAGLDAAEGPGLQVRLHAEGRPGRVEGPGRVPGARRQPDARPSARATSGDGRSAAYFGGQPRSAAAVAAGAAATPGLAAPPTPAAPKVAAPPSPAGGAKPAAKKKREGC